MVIKAKESITFVMRLEEAEKLSKELEGQSKLALP